MGQDLEIRRIAPELEEALDVFFAVLASAGEDDFFFPHPFTREQASRIAHYAGKDFYAAGLHRGEILAYGFLRGWDEGYETPSLGISIHPDYRGCGLGLAVMHYLQSVAVLRGCQTVRLRVNRDNVRAKRMYEKLGYVFGPDDEEYLVGFLELKARRAC